MTFLAADQVLNAVHRINNHIGAIRVHTKAIRDDLESGIPVDAAEFEQSLRLIEENAELALKIPDELRKRIGQLEESVDLNAENSFDQPMKVSPKFSTLELTSPKIPVEFGRYSINVYRIPIH